VSGDQAYKSLLDDHTRLQAKHKLLERVVHLFGAPDHFEEVFEGLLDAVMDYFSVEAASLYVIDSEKDELYIAAARGPKAAEVIAMDKTLVPGEGVAGACFKAGETIVISDTSADERFSKEIPEALGYDVRSMLTTPLSQDGETLGVLQLLNQEGDGVLPPEAIETATQLGRLAGSLIGLGWRLRALSQDQE
jgi:GAF domain-containing protein